ncbi:MAG: T9SS type A sorting domain-containing protein [Owenweeksia sp.]|nr:T9SS type A sorting domain-containing protein [Owenweeksia sp.]
MPWPVMPVAAITTGTSANGNYTLEAIPYSGSGGNGTAGISKSLNLWVLDGGNILLNVAQSGTNNTDAGRTGPANTAIENKISVQRQVTGKISKANAIPPTIKVYPNPTTGAVTLEISHAKAGGELVLMDVSGKILIQERLPARKKPAEK